MKQKIFTLVLMLAFIVVGGKVFGQNEATVLIGSTYTYNLSDVASAVNATAVVTWETDTDVEINPVAPGFGIVGGAAPRTLSFTVKYGDPGESVSSGLIRVVITNDEAPTCSNFIIFPVTVLPAPIYALAITKDETDYDPCQERAGTGNNAPNATVSPADEQNSFTFTVTPVITNVPNDSTFNYSYDITLPEGTGLNGFTISSATTTLTATGTVIHTGVTNATLVPDVFTITFNTTTNLSAQTLTATLTDITTQELQVTFGSGSGTYLAISGGASTQSVAVNPVPAIGSFN